MKLTEKSFKIKKILNNSSLIVHDRFHEIVLIGRGIAFGMRTGDILDKGTSYEQRYQSSNRFDQFTTLLTGYSDLVIQMMMDTIQMIVEDDQAQFQSNDFRSIADHLAVSYTRIQKGEAIHSFFSFEIKALYPAAYQKSEEIAHRINLKYNFTIPEAEVGYIALHIQNLSTKRDTNDVELMTVIISDIYDLLTVKYDINLESKSSHYLRFLTHIRFLVEGALSHKKTLGAQVDQMLLKTYPKEAIISQEIVDIVESRMGIHISKEELIYILIHLVNVRDAN